MRKVYKAMTVLAVYAALCGYVCAEEEEEEEGGEQDFLFLIEEAYTQEQGEWQISMDFKHWNHSVETEIDGTDVEKTIVDMNEVTLGIEYGITDRLQVEVEVPYLVVDTKVEENGVAEGTDKSDGITDIEIGIAYGLLRDEGSTPAVTLALEATAPTGDEDKDLGTGKWGWGGAIAISKNFDEKFFIHANLGFECVQNVEEEGEEVDEKEIGYGIAGVYRLAEDLELLLELAGEYEKETSADEEETGHVIYAAPGIKYAFENELQLGVGIPIGLNNDSYDFGAIVKLQYEF